MRSLFFLFSIALGSAACSTVTILEADGGGGGTAPVGDPVGTIVASTSQAATTDATTGAGGQGGEDSGYPQGMFDCDFTPTCEHVFIYQGDPSGGLRCTAELALSGKSGIVIEESTEGGINPATRELLVLFEGDGTAYTQERFKQCPSCEWEPNPATHVLRCSVVVSPDVAAACAFGTDGCAATPSETLADDCVVEEIPQCATPAGFLP